MIKKEAHINIMCLIQKENYKKSHKNQFFRPGNGVSCLTGDSRMWQPHWGKGGFFLSGQGLFPIRGHYLPWCKGLWTSGGESQWKVTLSAAVTSVPQEPWGALDPRRVPWPLRLQRAPMQHSTGRERCPQGAAKAWKVDLSRLVSAIPWSASNTPITWLLFTLQPVVGM